MNVNHDELSQKATPNWVFRLFGTLFIAFLWVVVARFLSEGIQVFDLKVSNNWLLIAWEFLLALVLLLYAAQIRRQHKTFYASVSSILLAIFAIVSIAFLNSIVERNEHLIKENQRLVDQTTILYEEIYKLIGIVDKLDPDYFKPPQDGSSEVPISIASPGDEGNDTTDIYIIYITALSGLITAISGFYSQVINARKIKAELELQKMKLEIEQKQKRTKTKERLKPKQKVSKKQNV